MSSTGNQTSMEAGVNTATPAGYSLRIQPTTFLAFIASFLAVAVVSAMARTVVRYYHLRRFYADDYFLFYALAAGGAAAGVAYSIKDQVYEQIYVGLYWQPPPDDFYEEMLVFEKRIQVCSILIWSLIYAVKFSFLALFRKLVDRVRSLEIQWWIVTSITILFGLASMPLSFIICSNFTSDYMEYCSIDSQLTNERIYLDTTSTLDIISDLLVISIPVTLLWRVRLDLRRKLALGSMLCLSFAMIVMTIVRVAFASLPTGVTDTSWLIFWQGIEAATAIIVVSLTAFRGVFGKEASKGSKRSKPLMYRPGGSGGASSRRPSQKQYEGLLEHPPAAKGRPGTFFRYKGGSVMDEETQVETGYDVSEIEMKEGRNASTVYTPPRVHSRLDAPFPAEPTYSAIAYH